MSKLVYDPIVNKNNFWLIPKIANIICLAKSITFQWLKLYT